MISRRFSPRARNFPRVFATLFFPPLLSFFFPFLSLSLFFYFTVYFEASVIPRFAKFRVKSAEGCRTLIGRARNSRNPTLLFYVKRRVEKICKKKRGGGGKKADRIHFRPVLAVFDCSRLFRTRVKWCALRRSKQREISASPGAMHFYFNIVSAIRSIMTNSRVKKKRKTVKSCRWDKKRVG